MRHVRNLRKIPKDHPCYPGNQKLNPVQFLDVVYEDEGGDPEPAPPGSGHCWCVEHALDDDFVIGDEGGDPEPAPRVRTLLMMIMLNMPLTMILWW